MGDLIYNLIALFREIFPLHLSFNLPTKNRSSVYRQIFFFYNYCLIRICTLFYNRATKRVNSEYLKGIAQLAFSRKFEPVY